MSGLEAKLGPSSEVLQIIHREMERDYYEAESKLVDPLLARYGTYSLFCVPESVLQRRERVHFCSSV